MTAPVLVDTDVISFLFKNHPLADTFRPLLYGRNACVALATVAEIEFGMEVDAWGDARRDRMRSFLFEFTTLLPDLATARQWAQIRSECQRVGPRIAPMDAWIAATAVQYPPAGHQQCS